MYTTEDGSVIDVPILLPSSWLRCLLGSYKFLLDGGHGQNFHEQLSAFWTCYKFYQPGHVAFQRSKEVLSSTIPVVVHGDEGRYLKKGNWMVCAFEPILGIDGAEKNTKRKPCTCDEDPVMSRYGNIGCGHVGDQAFLDAINLASKQLVNDSGNEFLTKHLLFGMSSLLYKKHKELLKRAFMMVSTDLTALHESGLTVDGHTYFVSTVGIKGDLKFHHQVGHLTRSYFNIGTTRNHPICSLCLAGSDGVDFENTTDEPPWLRTMFTVRPWNRGDTPALASIPFDPNQPEGLFRLDLFHCWKGGLGRDLTGSTLIILCQLQYFDFESDSEFNLPARLKRAHSLFVLWCQATGKSPALHSFSKLLLNYKNERSFAWFNTKGSDTTLLTAWLLFTVKLSIETNGYRYQKLETALVETLGSAKSVFQLLRSHPLWLRRHCAQRAQHHLTVMLRGYKVLAREARNLKVVAYGFKPKLHAVDHINKDLRKQIKGKSPLILNPMAFSCEANESVVGHVSEIARRVNSRLASTRVLDRITIKVKSVVRKYKTQFKLRTGRFLRR